MEKKEFIEILKKYEIPAHWHKLWWEKSQDKGYKNKFGFRGNQEELEKQIKILKEKGCATSAPW